MHKRLNLFALMLAWPLAFANDIPRVAECQKPVYSLDHYEGDQEQMLKVAIESYKACLLHVVSSYEKSGRGSPYETRFAERAIERIDLDMQAVWPRTEIIESARDHGLWSEDQTAAAVSIRDEYRNHIYVLVAQPAGGFFVVDITPIEQALVGKLGTFDKSEYEHLETHPAEWLSKSYDHWILSVRLEAWREGRRYVVDGPVVIKFDGTIVWQ